MSFPKWGFWTQRDHWYGEINVTSKVHLFLSDKETACGYVPTRDKFWFQYMRYRHSEQPKIGIWGLDFELKNGRPPAIDDFKKCKRCLKYKTKEE